MASRSTDLGDPYRLYYVQSMGNAGLAGQAFRRRGADAQAFPAKHLNPIRQYDFRITPLSGAGAAETGGSSRDRGNR
jgi:hypothetical protein